MWVLIIFLIILAAAIVLVAIDTVTRGEVDFSGSLYAEDDFDFIKSIFNRHYNQTNTHKNIYTDPAYYWLQGNIYNATSRQDDIATDLSYKSVSGNFFHRHDDD
jgi:hypothetical protein